MAFHSYFLHTSEEGGVSVREDARHDLLVGRLLIDVSVKLAQRVSLHDLSHKLTGFVRTATENNTNCQLISIDFSGILISPAYSLNAHSIAISDWVSIFVDLD